MVLLSARRRSGPSSGNRKGRGPPDSPDRGDDGLGEVWQPNRFKRLFASAAEESVPYLAPHAIFQYLPEETERLSKHRIDDIDRLLCPAGTIMQTCSGRNLGPSAMADAHTERYYVSDDLIRVTIPEVRMRNFAYAFMHSETGQGLLRRGKSGSVIDHLSVDHVAALEVPLLGHEVVDQVADKIGKALLLIADARLYLSGIEAYEAQLPDLSGDSARKMGWTVTAGTLTGRLDAAPYDPLVRRVRAELEAMGGKPVGHYGKAQKLERYSRVYVGKGYGSPFLSGSQMLQLQPINQQFMAARAVADVDRHRVHEGWIVYMADGRAEKGLGVPIYLTSDRDGWMASEHVGRIVHFDTTEPGWLWLACRTRHAQLQIKALAIGSVVDTTYPPDMESVILPPLRDTDGAAVREAWEKFATAQALEGEAIKLIDDRLAELSGVSADARPDAQAPAVVDEPDAEFGEDEVQDEEE